jgi:hypothetical protein
MTAKQFMTKAESADIFQYLEAKPPGTNRRSHFKTLKKLWRWAVQSGRVDFDPMSKLQPADEWGINAEHLSIAFYGRLLRVVAGKEPASKCQEPTTKYQFLLPYFVLGGMAGMRTCELRIACAVSLACSFQEVIVPPQVPLQVETGSAGNA